MTSHFTRSRDDVLDDGALTVTLFGDNDVLDRALSNELGRRGCRIHTVSVPSGWLGSTTHAIVRVETESGSSALHELAEGTQPPAHVVVICEARTQRVDTTQVNALCATCGLRHDTSLMWHRHVEDAPAEHTTEQLASTVADALQDQAVRDTGPSFVTHLVSD